MNNQNLMPQATQPVHRTTPGQLPRELAELSEEALHQHGDLSAFRASGVWPQCGFFGCSYDGDDAE